MLPSNFPCFCRALMLFVSLSIVGCAAPQKDARMLWPAPPDDPRFEFVGMYRSVNDFPKSRGEKLLAAAIGALPSSPFRTPVGIASNGKGIVFVSDINDANIKVFNFNTEEVHYLTKGGVLGRPVGLDLDSQGRLFAVDTQLKKVLVFSPEGLLRYSFPVKQLVNPSFIELHEGLGRVYVSDGRGGRIGVYSMKGKHLFSFGRRGNWPGAFLGPQGLGFYKNELFVCDYFNARIQVFTPDGKFLRSFGERGEKPWQFEGPKDLDFDSEGNLHIVDVRKHALITYRPDGTLMLFTGGTVDEENPFGYVNPNSIYVDSNDRIFVTDSITKRFNVWQYLSKEYLQQNPITEEDLERIRQFIQEKAVKEQPRIQ